MREPIPSMKWYDDPFEMRLRIEKDGLSGLRAVEKARSEAGYGRGERMCQWIVMGRYVLDTCGNMGLALPPAPADLEPEEARENPVVPLDEASRLFARYRGFSFGCGSVLPPADARCDRCGRGWELDNAADLSDHREAPRHIRCHQYALDVHALAEFERIFVGAGIPVLERMLIPNEYMPFSADYQASPWSMNRTPRGRIKVGWRKRVIVVDWEDSSIGATGRDIVGDDKQVTFGERMVHCYGWGAAQAALERLNKFVIEDGKGWT